MKSKSPAVPDASPSLVSVEKQQHLGTRLTELVTLLHSVLEPYEEWALEKDFTTVELLQALKEEGVFKDLRILHEIGGAVEERLEEQITKVKKTYGGRPSDKALQRAAKGVMQSLRDLKDPSRPLFSELIQQLDEIHDLHYFTFVADQINDQREKRGTPPSHLEWVQKVNYLKTYGTTIRGANYCNLLMLASEFQEAEPLPNLPIKNSIRMQPFSRYRWEELEVPGEPNGAIDVDVSEMQCFADKNFPFHIALEPIRQEEGRSYFELLRVTFDFVARIPDPTIRGFNRQIEVAAAVSLSRVHSELTILRNGYVSLRPIFRAYGLEGLYEQLRELVWCVLDQAVEDGQLAPMAPQPKEEPEPEVVEAVTEETHAELAETVEEVLEPIEEAPAKAKLAKGERTSIRNISIEDVEATLRAMGFKAERQRASHLTITGFNFVTGRMESYTLPMSLKGGTKGTHTAPYIAKAARAFGFTRKDFLRAYSKL